MTSGKFRLSLRPTRMTGAVEAAIEAVQPAVEARSLHLERQLDPDIGVVRADPDRIQQVVWNLLSNAVKFTPSGGKVSVSLTREGRDVVLKVVDTGIGISQELIPRVFDRFRQGEAGTTRHHGGLGLGLAIARQLVELHGGTLICTSPGEGKGATFVARLPLPAQRGVVAIDPVAAAEHDGKLAARYVLVVEDEETTRTSLETLLRIAGADVTGVDSAAAAVEAFNVRRPDVIVSDIAMQDEDGYTLINRLRTLERENRAPPVPALALTALAHDDDRQRAFAAGFNAYESKPIEPERLLSVIAALTDAAE
jgi:CheY-like chemotaxis protein/anti-sigma regulatory factor (Ser/Thr protein kinase)